MISVIVPTMNSAAHLGALLQSLATQTFRDFELVVSDGGSTDYTIALAQLASAALPAMRIDSRRDLGVYDAINRGTRLARGQWLLVLGSDDRLHAVDTLARAAALLVRSRAELVYGDVRMMAANSNGVPAGGRYAGALTLDDLLSKNICQQAIFYRRTLFEAVGGFDLRYRLWADWDFNLRTAFRGPLEWIDVIVADYAATGMSAQRSDTVFEADAPERLRQELQRRPFDRALWPLHRRLLRQADALRRRGRWREAARQIGTYALLRARRMLSA